MKRSHEMYEEHNVSRLGLISIMKALPEKHRERWTEQTTINGVPGQITCYIANPTAAARSLGVPHGWDNDVVSAVHTLYVANGCPKDGLVTTTAANLLRMIGASPNGEYYARLMESLDRLHNTHYHLTEHWFNARKSIHSAASFTQFSDVQKTYATHPFNEQDHQTIITVTLNRFIKENIEDEHLIRLNPSILTPLPSPTARAFYRLLETMRSPGGYKHPHIDTLQVDLNVLRSRARILSDDTRTSRTQRIFDPALGLLKKLGYLKDVESVRIGTTCGYRLTFSDVVEVIDAVALEMLVAEGVTPSQARLLATRVERDVIRDVIQHVRDRNEQGAVRNVPGLINTLLTGENAGKLPSLRPRPGQPKTITRAPTGKKEPRQARTPDDADRGTETPTAARPERQKTDPTKNALALLGVICDKLKTPAGDRATLQNAIQVGDIDITDLHDYLFRPNVNDLLTLAAERATRPRDSRNDPNVN